MHNIIHVFLKTHKKHEDDTDKDHLHAFLQNHNACTFKHVSL